MNKTEFTSLPYPDFMLDGGSLLCYYGGTVAALLAAERERCAKLCRQAMPQPVTSWSDAQIVEALRAVLEHVVGPNVEVTCPPRAGHRSNNEHDQG